MTDGLKNYVSAHLDILIKIFILHPIGVSVWRSCMLVVIKNGLDENLTKSDLL
jgi:hypothetical protein